MEQPHCLILQALRFTGDLLRSVTWAQDHSSTMPILFRFDTTLPPPISASLLTAIAMLAPVRPGYMS
jgi:hypothetical protein